MYVLRDCTKKRFTFNIKLGDVLQVCGRYDDIWRQSPGDLSISCISCIQVNVGRKGFFCFSSEKFSVFGGKTKKVGQSDRLSKWPVHTYLYHDNHDSCLSSKWVHTYLYSRIFFLTSWLFNWSHWTCLFEVIWSLGYILGTRWLYIYVNTGNKI